MTHRPAPRNAFWRRAGVIFGVATLLVLFFATKFYYGGVFHGTHPTWTKQLWWQAMEWYAWALFLPLIFRFCRKVESSPGRSRKIVGQLLGGVVFSLLHCAVLTTGARVEAWALQSGMSWWDLLQVVFINHFHSNVFTYAAIVGGWHAMEYYRQARERERRAAELEASLTRARLQALKMQLHPHFLFNTLNGIASLNYEDPKAANRMLARLSELLRMALENDGAQEVPLRRELEFNRRYLELEKIRLGDRLTVNLEIAPETMAAAVPNLLLQPLVENAIRHGIAPFSAPGRVSICARREGSLLRLQVRDNGPGIAAGKMPADIATGVGLANTRARLRELYGAGHSLELKNLAEGGLLVDMTIPFRAAETDEIGSSVEFYEDSHARRG